MAVTQTPRLGITRWSNSDTDAFSRVQLDSDHAKLEDLAAIDRQGLRADRPAPGVRGRYYTATDTGVIYRDDGAAWSAVGSRLEGGVTITPLGAADVPMTVAGLAGHTGNLTSWKVGTGLVARVTNTGAGEFAALRGGAGAVLADSAAVAQVKGAAGQTGAVPLVVDAAAAGQTANLTQWRSAAGGVLGSVDALGRGRFPSVTLQNETDAATPALTIWSQVGAVASANVFAVNRTATPTGTTAYVRADGQLGAASAVIRPISGLDPAAPTLDIYGQYNSSAWGVIVRDAANTQRFGVTKDGTISAVALQLTGAATVNGLLTGAPNVLKDDGVYVLEREANVTVAAANAANTDLQTLSLTVKAGQRYLIRGTGILASGTSGTDIHAALGLRTSLGTQGPAVLGGTIVTPSAGVSAPTAFVEAIVEATADESVSWTLYCRKIAGTPTAVAIASASQPSLLTVQPLGRTK